jgi:hypothetical protein
MRAAVIDNSTGEIMRIGNRASLQAIPRKTVTVRFEEYDTEYRLREMSGTDRDKFEVAAFKEDAEGVRHVQPLYLRARMVALCLVDENNVRLYADDEIEQLSDEIPASVIAVLFVAAQKLNGLGTDAVEAAAKNSESAPAGASASA